MVAASSTQVARNGNDNKTQQQTLPGQPQQQQAQETQSPLLQTLAIGNGALNKSLNSDKSWPELGDILTRWYFQASQSNV